MAVDVKGIAREVEAAAGFVTPFCEEIGRVIVGQTELVERILIAMLAGGHALLEGVPGLAKTLTIHTAATAFDASFKRIQFTPDLLPADLTGTLVYSPKTGEFSPRLGPVFTNVLLADEINRAPAKVQSALLEAMQEHQVTIGEKSYPIEEPFLVLATQNPIEQEGTYPLPEAQVDRFMLKLKVGYPAKSEERTILDRAGEGFPEVKPVVTRDDLFKARGVARKIYMDDKLKDYIVDLVHATRRPADYGLKIESLVAYGASPRATIYLAECARAHAFLERRGYVTPQDVKSIAMDVLRHRVILTYEAEAEEKTPEWVVQTVLDSVEVP
ncbi:MAG: AAA family ATPase [Planctomycetota bacterium]|jgi:MoxR-like ATPase